MSQIYRLYIIYIASYIICNLNQIKLNQFIAQHNIVYKNSGHKIIQAYHMYGCAMESGEAKLSEPWSHCLQNKIDIFLRQTKIKPKKEHALHNDFCKNKSEKIKIAILNINHRFQKIATDCEAKKKRNLNQRHYNNFDSKNNFNFLLKMFNDKI